MKRAIKEEEDKAENEAKMGSQRTFSAADDDAIVKTQTEFIISSRLPSSIWIYVFSRAAIFTLSVALHLYVVVKFSSSYPLSLAVLCSCRTFVYLHMKYSWFIVRNGEWILLRTCKHLIIFFGKKNLHVNWLKFNCRFGNRIFLSLRRTSICEMRTTMGNVNE